MTINPEQSSDINGKPGGSTRSRRARQLLLFLAAITAGVSAWEILNHNLFNGWSALPLQLFRVAVPLVLLRLIWNGRLWARYLLVAWCAFILCVNLPAVTQLPEMISHGQTGNAIFVVCSLIGYGLVGTTALLSPAITDLMYLRRDERELAT